LPELFLPGLFLPCHFLSCIIPTRLATLRVNPETVVKFRPLVTKLGQEGD
jgi:hypothetical protein